MISTNNLVAVPYIDNSAQAIDTGIYTVDLTINSLDVIQPDEATEVKVVIPVTVGDVDALLAAQDAALVANNEFLNTAQIIASITGVQKDPLEVSAVLNFTACNLYGLGNGNEVTRAANEKVDLMYTFPAISSLDTDDIVYTAVIDVSSALDIAELISVDDIKIEVGNEAVIFYAATTPTVLLGGDVTTLNSTETNQILTITFPHKGQFSGQFVTVTIPATINEIFVNDVNTELFNSFVNLSIDNIAEAPESICVSDEFTMTVSASDEPSISQGSKTILFKLVFCLNSKIKFIKKEYI